MRLSDTMRSFLNPFAGGQFKTKRGGVLQHLFYHQLVGGVVFYQQNLNATHPNQLKIRKFRRIVRYPTGGSLAMVNQKLSILATILANWSKSKGLVI